MPRTVAAALLAGAALLVCAQTGRADVRILHLSPDTPPVNIYAGVNDVDPKGLLLSDLAYLEDRGYLPVAPGTYFVDVTPASDPGLVALDINDLVIESGKSYTAAAIGSLGGANGEPLQALVLEDDAIIDNMMAQVRLVHASPNAPAVDVLVNGSVALSNFTFGSATGYLSLDPGSYDIAINEAGTSNTVFSINGLGLAAGQVSTAWAVGLLGDNFDVFLTSDIAAVPEPASIALVGVGLLGLAVARRRRRAA